MIRSYATSAPISKSWGKGRRVEQVSMREGGKEEGKGHKTIKELTSSSPYTTYYYLSKAIVSKRLERYGT